ncbi:hypothetical protein FOL47_002021 [Perkinsus chesapeaki]|uniref:BAR domain-containing protein n=1 Tax=Perkinsus chesapeaki TaxID=330153 RepID=A0A7J6MFT4_PERCH|nr:hypothetical protein FOL47_002021 [Perkinsus chesapeaki]
MTSWFDNKTFRSMKEKMFGVKEFDEDPLVGERKDLLDYNSKLLQLSSEVDHITANQQQMNPRYLNVARFSREAADPKSSTSTESTAGSEDTSAAFAVFSEQMSHFNHSGENSLACLGRAKGKIDRLDGRIKTLRTDLTDRDRAHGLVKHYEVKTDDLQKKYQKKVENGSSSDSAKEKLDRNLVKFREAQENCDRLDRSVDRDIKDILGRRQKDVGEIVEALSQYFSSTVTQNRDCVDALSQTIPEMVAKIEVPQPAVATATATPVVQGTAVLPKVQTPEIVQQEQSNPDAGLPDAERSTEPLIPTNDTREAEKANELRAAPEDARGEADVYVADAEAHVRKPKGVSAIGSSQNGYSHLE